MTFLRRKPPHLATKVRSNLIMSAPEAFFAETGEHPDCHLRISSFFGMSCSSSDTCVMAHSDGVTKGMSSKTSDLEATCACQNCHDILDRIGRGFAVSNEHGAEFEKRIRHGAQETRAMLIDMGVIIIKDGDLI